MLSPVEITAELEWLEGRVLWGMKVGLETMQVMCERLGHPERSFRSVLIGGTNGKGSVASTLAELLYSRPNAPKVGLYTSPHLVGVQERVRVQGQWIQNSNLALHLREIREASSDRQPTFFEVMTLVALLEFRTQKVDLALFEVGLGGRLDSTNIVHPELSIISSIGLDHVEILGSDEESILKEKLGIARADGLLLSGVVQQSLRPLLANTPCKELLEWDSLPKEKFQALDLNFELPQDRNQILALQALELLGYSWQVDEVKKLLRNFVWAGRFQVFNYRGMQIFLDGAHNADGARALKQSLAQKGLKVDASLVAMVGDKDSKAWFEVLGDDLGQIYYCKGRSERFKSPEVLMQIAGRTGSLHDSWRGALDSALQKGHRLLLLSGSLYLVGEVIEGLCAEVDEFSAYRELRPMVNERAFAPKK